VQVHRPGPVGLAWNWLFELAILAAVTGLSIAITGSIGFIGLAAVSGAGLAAGTALLCWPPARRSSPGPGA
jgi:ABC-type cobalamin transport system permease subunit